jgi:hypothetical protein
MQALGHAPYWRTDVDYCSGLNLMTRPATIVLEVAPQQEHSAFWRRPPKVNVSGITFAHFRCAQPALDGVINNNGFYFVSRRDPELRPIPAVCYRQLELVSELSEGGPSEISQ